MPSNGWSRTHATVQMQLAEGLASLKTALVEPGRWCAAHEAASFTRYFARQAIQSLRIGVNAMR